MSWEELSETPELPPSSLLQDRFPGGLDPAIVASVHASMVSGMDRTFTNATAAVPVKEETAAVPVPTTPSNI
jgi:hypothetical protein